MTVTPQAITDVLLIEPKVLGDERGGFFESFNQQRFSETTGLNFSFAQDNHSKSAKNVLRGLHYQLPPKAQGKLVQALAGEVFDVAVDIRKNSPTFGKWFGEILSVGNKRQLWIPPGLAHGFLVLSESADFLYKTTDYYALEHERGILWSDPVLAIEWPIKYEPLLSGKEQGQIWNVAEVLN